MNKLFSILAAATTVAPISATTFDYVLPHDAYVTLVIEDAAGRRVRNLISDAPRQAGRIAETWDGRDDNGNPVPTGEYRWRGLTHGGISAHWLGSFYSPGSTPWKRHTRPGGWNLRASGAGGWLSDHTAPWCLFADDRHVYIGCKTAEAGDAIIQSNLDGEKIWGTLWLGLSGANAMCAERGILHVAGEGHWMGARMGVNLFDIVNYRWVPLPKEVKSRHIQHDSALVRENSSDFSGIQGMFLTCEDIAVVFSDKRRVSYFDRANGLWKRDEPLKAIEARIRRPSAKILHGVATDADGNLYRCDTNRCEQCVKVYAPDGRFLRRIGKPGGRREGAYDPLAMGNPVDVAIDARGQVWVCENCFLPKRVSIWTRDGRLVREIVGTPYYGGGGSIDAEGKYAYYSGMRLRLADGLSGAKLESILFDPEEHPNVPFPVRKIRDWALPGPSTVRSANGRTWLVSDDGPCRTSTFIGEIVGDLLVPRTVCGKEMSVNAGAKSVETGVFLWQDGNRTVSDAFRYGAEWSMRLGPGLEIFLHAKDRKSIVVLTPDANGRYDFNRAETVALPKEFAGICSLSLTPDGSSFIINRGGCGNQGSPENLFGAVSRDGRRVLWTYPNPYPSNTHNSPVPRRGELRHTLGVEGFSAAAGGILMLNGNKGTRYLFTCDGLFVTELFGDSRLRPTTQNLTEAKHGMVFSDHSLSDECFGGWIGDVRGKPHLIVGKDSLNICALKGTESVSRLAGGSVRLSKRATPLENMPLSERGPTRTVKAAGFGLNHFWWKLAETEFPPREPVARFSIGWSDCHLTLHYDVTDSTPFENGGDDAATLFHSGDALDFRWEGNPSADPKRRKALCGDQRLVIAPFGEKTLVMRYVFVDPAATADPMVFASPVGKESVDRVEEVAGAKTAVTRRADGYCVRIDIPWKELGEKTPFAGGLRRADAGVIFGDPTGTRVVRREYMFDPGSQEVSDIPSEVRVDPSKWGMFEF